MLTDLLRLTTRPEPFAPGAPFWADPVIAETLLATHLDPEAELASRRPADLDAAVANLVAHGLAGPGVRVLDLGCGPGLVAERLAVAGCRVTGVDISAGSLTHARESARAAGLDIAYRQQDFRDLDDEQSFDLVLQSYGELSTLDPATRDGLLAARRALVLGGALVFDVTTPLAHPPVGRTWSADDGGLWRRGPHLVLTEQHRDDDDLTCEQYLVADPPGVEVHRMWFQDYTPATLTPVLAAAGFTVEETWGALSGARYRPDGDWFAVLARPLPAAAGLTAPGLPAADAVSGSTPPTDTPARPPPAPASRTHPPAPEAA